MDTMTDLTSLRDAGDTVTLDDGRGLRLRIETDYWTKINDFDTYGRTEEFCHDYSGRDARAARPDDFNGNAEKLQCGRGEWIWWQPPADVRRDTETFRKVRREVRDLLEYGFSVVSLELLDGVDTYLRPIVVDVASLGGIDSVAPEYLQDVLSDLRAELLG